MLSGPLPSWHTQASKDGVVWRFPKTSKRNFLLDGVFSPDFKESGLSISEEAFPIPRNFLYYHPVQSTFSAAKVHIVLLWKQHY